MWGILLQTKVSDHVLFFVFSTSARNFEFFNSKEKLSWIDRIDTRYHTPGVYLSIAPSDPENLLQSETGWLHGEPEVK